MAKQTNDASDAGKKEFLDEIRKMKQFEHPHIARIVESVESRLGDIFIITELAEGGDLFKYTAMILADLGDRRLTEDWVSGVFKQALEGVAYLHYHGVRHNDLKPDNILVLKKYDAEAPLEVPAVTITDFGCATLRKDRRLTCGDPRYCSPEGFDVIDALMNDKTTCKTKTTDKVDIWSMGAILFELLSGGKLPYLYRPMSLDEFCSNQEEGFDKLRVEVKGPRPIDLNHCTGISSEARDLLSRMLCKDQSARPDAPGAVCHEWFNIRGHSLDTDCVEELRVHTTKGTGHAILLNALALRLQREHYQQCWRVFQKIDKKCHGTLCKAEFVSGCAELKLNTSEGGGRSSSFAHIGNAETVFDHFDIDRSGEMTFGEFLGATFPWQSLAIHDRELLLQELFNELDTNGDGYIDIKELRDCFQGTVEESEMEILSETIRLHYSKRHTHDNIRMSIGGFKRFVVEPSPAAPIVENRVVPTNKTSCFDGCFGFTRGA